MWEYFEGHFKQYPAQARVARYLLDIGISVKDGKLYADRIKVSFAAVAKAMDVDQRVVGTAVERIEANTELREAFSKITPSCNLKDIGALRGWQTIEIMLDSPQRPGVLGKVASTVGEANVNIRQVIGEDPSYRSGLIYIIAEEHIPGYVLDTLRKIPGVKGITIH